MTSRLFPTDDGWFEWRQEPSLAVAVFVRLAPDDEGRLHLTELRLVGEPTSEALRTVPVGRIAAAANAQLTVAPAVSLPDGEPARGRSRRRGVVDPSGTVAWELAPTTKRFRTRPAPTIKLPAALRHGRTGRGRSDAFYGVVADVYRHLAQTTSRPAAELAEANDVPLTTAHRWIKEARRRGLLPPGRPGKAG